MSKYPQFRTIDGEHYLVNWCPACDGEGYVWFEDCTDGFIKSCGNQQCEHCNGDGKIKTLLEEEDA